MKASLVQPNSKKASLSVGRGCLRAITYVLSSALVTILTVTGCALSLEAIILTTPGRDQNIGALPGISYQDVTLDTADGLKLSAWYVPGTRPDAVIIVHGIHANRAYLIPQAVILAQAGYHLLLFDLRGHGRSEGHEVTYGYREALDIEAAVDYLTGQPGIQRVGALGHSLGAAAVVRAAAMDQRLQAIVIQSSFSSLAEAAEESRALPWPFRALVLGLAQLKTGTRLDQVNSARDLATMPPRPVLIIHSADDGLFPLHHAQEMYEAAQEPKELWIIDRVGGHVNPIGGHEAEYQERILKFFDKAFAQP